MLHNTTRDLGVIVKPTSDDAPLESLLWHELDPCCQRELESDRKKKEINDRLRSVDRSYSRFDAKSNIFSSTFKSNSGTSSLLSAGETCLCCTTSSTGKTISSFHSEPSEYPLLAQLRSDSIENSTAHVFSFDMNTSSSAPDQSDFNLKSEETGTASSDDDSGDDDFVMDELTPFEVARLATANEVIQKYKSAVSRGFACHIDMNVDNLTTLINANVIPLIVHIYQPESIMDALLDLQLEKLAARYLGTMFRRSCISLNAQKFIDSWSHKSSRNRQGLLVGSLDVDRNRSQCGHLLVFQGKDLKVYTSDLYQFGDGGTLFPNAVTEFLDNAHCLQEQPVAITRSQMALRSRSNKHFQGDCDDQQDELMQNKFCDDPHCNKRYPHEHIAGRGGVTFAGKLDNDLGIEALARNTFYKI